MPSAKGATPVRLPEAVRTLSLRFSSELDSQTLRLDPDSEFMEPWTVEAVVYPDLDDSDTVEVIGSLTIWRVAFQSMDRVFDQFDAVSGDLSVLGEVVAYDRERLDEACPPYFGTGLFVECFELEAPWRGLGLGPVVAGLAIKRLGPAADFVMLEPAPISRDELSPTELEAARQKLVGMWERLGFERFNDRVWVASLVEYGFEAAFEKVYQQFLDRVGN